MPPTPLRQLTDERLNGHLDGLVTGLHLGGWGWRRIAAHVSEKSGMTVSHETLRGWFPDLRKPKDGVAA